MQRQELRGGATLGAVVAGSGAGLIEVIEAPGGFDVAVGKPAIATTTDAATIEAGDLVLAVGIDAEEPGALSITREAGARGACGVTFRLDHKPPASLCTAAEESGVALLAVPGQTTWDQIYALVETAVAAADEVAWARQAGVDAGDLFTLANAIAAMVGGPVTIEDRHSRLLAYSSSTDEIDDARRASILERRTPEPWRRRFEDAGVFAHLNRSDAPLRVDQFTEEGLRRRLVIAVRTRGDLLGTIWVAEGNEPLGPASESALVEASRIAATNLAREHAVDQIDRRNRSELLRAVLEGRGSGDVIISRLGLTNAGQCAVLAFRFVDHDEPVSRERLLDLVAVRCETYRRQSACVAIGGSVYALVPVPADGGDGLLALAADVADLVNRGLGQPVYAGVGGVVDQPLDAPASRQDAERVVAALARRAGAQHVARLEDVHASIVVDELRSLVRDWAPPQIRALETLRDHDVEHTSDYVTTVRAYLDTYGDVTAVAQRLGVHANTVRYRLRRVRELLGLDLDDSDERLAVELTLRLWP